MTLLEQLEALAGKVTPGPWVADEDPTQDGDHTTMVMQPGKNGAYGTWIAGCIQNWNDAAFDERRISWKEAESNAALIVLLRNALPEVIATLEAQQEPINTCEMPEVAAMRYIEQLRGSMGASVTILCDDDEAWTRDKQMAIEVCAEWTNWEPCRFYGESTVQCLAKAMAALPPAPENAP